MISPRRSARIKAREGAPLSSSTTGQPTKNDEARKKRQTRPKESKELVVTKMVTSEKFGDSVMPWKVNKDIWNRLDEQQQKDVQWLQNQYDHRTAGLILDKKKTGKHISLAVFLRSISETKRKNFAQAGLDSCLILCPTNNHFIKWSQVFKQWFPKLRVFYHEENDNGRNKKPNLKAYSKMLYGHYLSGAVVLSTYEAFRNDPEAIREHLWQVVFVEEDENNRISEQLIDVLFDLDCPCKFAVTCKTREDSEDRRERLWTILGAITSQISIRCDLKEIANEILEKGTKPTSSQSKLNLAYQTTVALTNFLKAYVFEDNSGPIVQNLQQPPTSSQLTGTNEIKDQKNDAKAEKNKMKLYENKPLSLLLLTRKDWRHLRTHTDGAELSKNGKLKFQKLIKTMMSAKSTSIYLWKPKFHQIIQKYSSTPLELEYYVEKKEKEKFFEEFGFGSPAVDKKEINKYLVFAKKIVEYLNGITRSNIVTLGNIFDEDIKKLGNYWAYEIISNLAMYEYISQNFVIRKNYSEVKMEDAKKRKYVSVSINIKRRRF